MPYGQQRISVVIADDHAVVRRGLRMLLEQEPDMEVLAEAGDVEEARQALANHRPGILLLDLNMPGPPTLDKVPELLEVSPGTRIVVLTMEDDAAVAQEALRRGASGYVRKGAEESDLAQAIRAVAGGGRFVSEGLSHAVAPSAEDDLSPREIEVLRLIALGHTNPEIGEALGIGVRTVETHRRHIQEKLRMSSRAELVRYALDRGLLASES